MTLLEAASSAAAVRATGGSSQYSRLLALVKAEGLLQKQPKFYLKRLAILSALALATWGGLVVAALLSGPWVWALGLPLALFQGILAAQFGFIAHEAAHRQIFTSNRLNDRVGLVLANGLAGLSYGFWLKKHNRHHAQPNTIGKDPDIAIRVLAFTPEAVAAKPWPERIITRHQGILFPILLTLTGFDLLMDSVVSVFRKDRSLGLRLVEAALMAARTALPIAFFLLAFGWVAGAVLWLGFMLSFGLFMGGAFAPNHKGMPLIPRDSKISFFQRQVLTSRNISPSWLTDNLMGGLNYQAEHHLFPSMPRPALRRTRDIVREFCAAEGIPHTEVGLFKSYGLVIRYLNSVGLSKNSDPFVCPMVAEMRPRF
jgi:fatty acid desaturase